jgi:hypothetical protein
MDCTVWLNAFLKRKSAISVCLSEASIPARVMNFNHASVNRFSDNLSKVLDENYSNRKICVTLVRQEYIVCKSRIKSLPKRERSK